MDEPDRTPDRTPERPPERVEARPVAPGTGQRRTILTAVAIVSALLIGIARPWDLVTPAPGGPAVVPGDGPIVTGPADDGRSAPPGQPAPDDPYAGLWTTCGSPSGWRAATIQQWAGRPAPIRSWIAIVPSDAVGPLDPRIPFAPVATDLVTAIGYCAPLDERLRPPLSARAELWAIVGGTPVPLTAVLLEPAEPDALGGLWRPAPEVAALVDGREVWPAGRYVLEIGSVGDAFHRWLGIEIDDVAARRTASPSPGGSPATPSTGAATPATSAVP